jgi:hypothetical protein
VLRKIFGPRRYQLMSVHRLLVTTSSNYTITLRSTEERERDRKDCRCVGAKRKSWEEVTDILFPK